MQLTNDVLNRYIKENRYTLHGRVAQWLIACASTPEERLSMLRYLQENGCVSGIVGELIYYKDTNDFYNYYENQIWELVSKYADEEGCSPLEFISKLNGAENVCTGKRFKNLMAWFGFEEGSKKLIEDLGLEI